MSEEKKSVGQDWTIAQRGGIYEFCDADRNVSDNVVLVVSADSRSRDRFINILMPGSSPLGNDVLPIEIDGQMRYLHCGMISYTSRERLGKKLFQLSPEVMSNIERLMAQSLGISGEADYKTLYNDLIAKLVSSKEEQFNSAAM